MELSSSAQRLLNKLSEESKKKKSQVITVSSLVAMRTNMRTIDKTIEAIRELQLEGRIELKEVKVEGRYEQELKIL